MTAAYAYHLNAASPAVQSGRPHSILLNFKKIGMEVQELFPLEEMRIWQRRFHKISSLAMGRHYLIDRDAKLLRGFATQLERSLRRTNADFIFSPSTLPLSYLETDLPVTFCADAPFCAMMNYYDSFTRLSPAQVELSEKLENGVLRRAALAVYPTQWAADQAIAHYGVPSEKIAVIPFGANFGRDNRREDVERWIEQRPMDGPLKILFVGREWERKGAPLVLETVEQMRAQGIKVQLDMVGCARPANVRWHQDSAYHGKLSPRDPRQEALLVRLYREAHFLFVPSRTEAYGMTFCEANAFGLPAITTSTGGITGVIRPGLNGFALPLEAGPEDYAKVILDHFQPPSKYREFCLRAFAEFEQRLNWESFVRDFVSHPTVSTPPMQRGISDPGYYELTPGDGPEEEESRIPGASRNPLRVAFLENEFLSSDNVCSWSGLPYHMRQAVGQAGIEIVPITVKDTSGSLRWAKFAYWRLLRHRRYLRYLDTGLLESYGRQIEDQLAKVSVDAVFAPSTWMIAHLHTTLPVVLWSDATFANVLNFYQAYSNLAPISVREGHAAERSALHCCSLALFSSDWAARSAVGDYGLASDRVDVVAFGANIEHGVEPSELEAVIAARPKDRCRMLLVGVDWERKGAALTLEIFRVLKARGLSVQLTIVGCTPPVGTEIPEGVEVTGFISKVTEEGRQKIDDLFRHSHFFVMPTRADCTPCVYAEANNYALPCVGTDVGGVASVIVSGVNGRTFALEAPAQEYADYIGNLMRDRPAYERLCQSSWNEGRERLSWRRSGERIRRLLFQLCANGKETSR